MNEKAFERRMAENEVVFRQFNESIQQGFDELNEVAKEQGEKPYELDKTVKLHFYCECTDENCTKRIQLLPQVYTDIHKRRDTFVIVCGHEVEQIEDIIERNPDYCVVRKHETPPEVIDTFNKTDVHNV
jgi:hypothetical protein